MLIKLFGITNHKSLWTLVSFLNKLINLGFSIETKAYAKTRSLYKLKHRALRPATRCNSLYLQRLRNLRSHLVLSRNPSTIFALKLCSFSPCILDWFSCFLLLLFLLLFLVFFIACSRGDFCVDNSYCPIFHPCWICDNLLWFILVLVSCWCCSLWFLFEYSCDIRTFIITVNTLFDIMLKLLHLEEEKVLV